MLRNTENFDVHVQGSLKAAAQIDKAIKEADWIPAFIIQGHGVKEQGDTTI